MSVFTMLSCFVKKNGFKLYKFNCFSFCFSDEKRMNNAIKSLLKTPQNNLKIFKVRNKIIKTIKLKELILYEGRVVGYLYQDMFRFMR